MQEMTIQLFGPMTVQQRGRPLPRTRTRTERWLLALLILRYEQETQREWLAATLWPDSLDAQALNNLRRSLSLLRSALGADAWRLCAPTTRTLQFDLTGAVCDVVAFDQAFARGDAESLEQAVELYRGPLLEGCSEEWIFAERQRREQAYLAAIETLAARATEWQQPDEAARWLQRAVATDPFRETAQRALMQALAAAGDHSGMTQAYRDFRLLLHHELNIQPDATTQALFQQLRQQARQPAYPLNVLENRVVSALPEILPLPTGMVTFLLTDIEGSSRLWEAHPEAMREALTRYESLAESLILQHQGHLLKHRGEGDSLFCVFARARDALAAAGALQRAYQQEDWPQETSLKVRMALHTGEADLRDRDYYGPAVNRCARLRAIGHGGQVLVSEATHDLVFDTLLDGFTLKSLGLHRLKDLSRPELIFQLLHPALVAEFPPLSSLDVLATNLPTQVTSFIGREKEIQEVKDLLVRTHLLTLNGAGGCGKTRLALQVAADLLDAYPDGVWLVELASISDPALVVQTMATTLGVREEPGRRLDQALPDFLKSRSLLLVLDNCEHLAQTCASLAEMLLAHCPHLRLLATSRQPLGILGEQAWNVPSLSLPDGSRPDWEKEKQAQAILMSSEAAQLFVERAISASPGFRLTRENLGSVAELCRLLDGIPLAIELAAGWVRMLPVRQVVARLRERLDLLQSRQPGRLGRHQTLRAALDWSYELLEEPEQRLMACLAVFVGGWTLEAAEAVCGKEGEAPNGVLLRLAGLVDMSLVVYEEQGEEGRYHLLETTRHYALEKLQQRREEPALRVRHRDYFLKLAEEMARKLIGPEQAQGLQRLETEHDNLRQALTFCLQERVAGQTGLRLGAALQNFWYVRGYVSEGRECLTALLSLPQAQEHTKARAYALNGAGGLAYLQGDYAAARSFHQESMVIMRELGNQEGTAWSLINQGNVAFEQGDFASARSLYAESLEIMRAIGDKRGSAFSLNNLGVIFRDQGDYEQAHLLFEESLTIRRELGDKGGIAASLYNLGTVADEQGNTALARSLHKESLSILWELGDRPGLAYSLESFGGMAFTEDKPEQAARLLGAAERLREEICSPLPPNSQEEFDRAVAGIRATLDGETYASAWAEGRAMTLEEAVAYALREPVAI